jgi:AcrR family transcriptional regulator
MWGMTRWEPNARGRLEEAAITLFRDRGYDNTTVAQIAERAGLTERTFFRHFADKREILFAGGPQLQGLVVAAVASAPDSATPLGAAVAGIEAAGAMLEEHRGRRFARQRQSIISSSAELRERELNKMAALAAAVREALQERGVDPPGAGIVAEVAVAIFRVAFERWVSDTGGPDLPQLMRESVERLRALTADVPLAGARN